MNNARLPATFVAALATMAAASNLHTALSGSAWIGPVFGAVVVAAVVGGTCRGLRLPVVVQPFLTLVGLLFLITALDAHTHAIAGFIPTGSSMTVLRHLMNQGINDIRDLTAPAVPTRDLVMLATISTGLVATAVDVLAVTGEAPPLAGLPLVLLVAVPAGIRERGVGTLTLLLAFIGFLALLATQSGARARRWGRVLAAPTPAGTLTPAGVGTGWRIGAMALVAALLVPVVIPGARHDPFGSAGDGGNDGTVGSRNATVIDPFVQIAAELKNQSNTPLLTVTSSSPSYVRLTALENLTDAGFSLVKLTAYPKNRIARGIPTQTLGTDGDQVTTDRVTASITASPALSEQFLPVPQNPTQASVSGDWRLFAETDTIFSTSTNLAGKSYKDVSEVPDPSPSLLAASGETTNFPASLSGDLEIPTDIVSAVAGTAQQWTAGSDSEYQTVLDIQDHFTDGAFTYNTTVPYQPGAAGYSEFLTAREGFCEQFASTMVAMLRALGIPARVAIGFSAGTETSPGTYVMTGKNAHAWPEVYFPSAGWIRFEPTPLTSGGLVPAYAQPNAANPAGSGTSPQSSTAPSTNPTPTPSASSTKGNGKNNKIRKDLTNPGPTNHHHNDSTPLQVAALIVIVLLLAALLPLTVTVVLRRRRYRAGLLPIWAQLLDDCADCGLLIPRSASPRTAGRLITAQLGHHGGAATGLATLVSAVEQQRYAPPATDIRTDLTGNGPGTGPGSAHDPRLAEHAGTVSAVRHTLTGALPLTARLRVLLFPPSAGARILSPLQRGATSANLGAERTVNIVVATFARLLPRRLRGQE